MSFRIESDWRRHVGIDPGMGMHHSTAVLISAVSPEGVIVVYDSHMCVGNPISCHVSWLKQRVGNWIGTDKFLAAIDKSGPIQEYQQQGVPCIPARSSQPNEKIYGLNRVNELFKFNRLFITANNVEVIKQVQEYRYQVPTGSEKPDRPLHREVLKKNDHACLAGDTEVLTTKGWRTLESISGRTFVLTTSGFALANAGLTREKADLYEMTFDDGYKVQCTSDHEFLTSRGWKAYCSMEVGDALCRVPHGEVQNLAGVPASWLVLPGEPQENSCTDTETPQRYDLHEQVKWDIERLVLASQLKDEISNTSAFKRVLVQKRRVGEGSAFCLGVPNTGSFLIRNGFLSSNCDALRYITDETYDMIPHEYLEPRLERPRGREFYKYLGRQIYNDLHRQMNNPANLPGGDFDSQPVEMAMLDFGEEW